MSRSDRTYEALPDPGRAGTLDELTETLRLLKVWAGDPSYDTITNRVNMAWRTAGRPDGELAKRATVAACFTAGRRRLNTDLVIAVVQALHPSLGYVTQWRQALRVIAGEVRAAAQVRVQDRLSQEMVGFTGRTVELERLRQALHAGGTVVCSGMAGVGKTQLAIHAAHLFARERPVDRVLFVNLRGFHPDPAQPPADPAAVLDGFLRLLGVPSQRIPHDLTARTAAYRERLAGSRTLVVLDNAADTDQVRPLLPQTPGCPVLVTSRRSLTTLPYATHLDIDVFTPAEALDLLTRTAPEVPVGRDPDATARIAHRCGHLPLALGLVVAHIRATSGWTLTDHADRLDERHHRRCLDSGVQLALDLSYHRQPADERRLLRLAALHPGPDLDAYAAAALSDCDLPTAQAALDRLCRDHLLQPAGPGRFTLHDLVRAHAAGRADDEDSPPQRRAALTRLFDYHLGTAATAMDVLYPAETGRQPHTPPPVSTAAPVLTDPEDARAWLDTERSTLVAVAAHGAAHGWPTHTTRLSTTLYRYLSGGYHSDALTIHGHARDAAEHSGDPAGRAHALTNLGTAYLDLGRSAPARECLQQALQLFRRAGDRVGQARAFGSLGSIEMLLGRYRLATSVFRWALTLCREGGDPTGEAIALGNLGRVETLLGRYRAATDHHEQALDLFRQTGDRSGQAWASTNLGDAERCLGRYGPAAEHLQQALTLYRQLGSRDGEAEALDVIGDLYTHLGQPTEATRHLGQALTLFRATGQREGEAGALNGLGEAARSAEHPADALAHHTEAHSVAVAIADRYQQARAHAGLGHAHRTLDQPDRARHHYRYAMTLYADLGTPEADRIRAQFAILYGAGLSLQGRHE